MFIDMLNEWIRKYSYIPYLTLVIKFSREKRAIDPNSVVTNPNPTVMNLKVEEELLA
jgi:hypothetical protein